jgi:hypothetical protein
VSVARSGDPILQDAPHRGRPVAVETAAEQLEGECYGLSAICVQGRPLWTLARQHDAAHDRSLAAALARARAIGDDALIATIRDAQRFDALEDAAYGQLARLWTGLHDAARRIAGWVEHVTTGRGR